MAPPDWIEGVESVDLYRFTTSFTAVVAAVLYNEARPMKIDTVFRLWWSFVLSAQKKQRAKKVK